jgi:hypothetical protein
MAETFVLFHHTNLGGWTNCAPSCAESCVPPLGPQISAHGGKIIPASECIAECKADGSGASSCDAHDVSGSLQLYADPIKYFNVISLLPT